MSWKKLAAIGLGLVSLLILWSTHQIWFAAFLGVLFALSLNGPAEWLRTRMRLPNWLATSLVLLVVLVMLLGLVWAIGSPLAAQFDVMSKALPSATQKVFLWLDERSWGQTVIQHVEDWSGISSELPRAGDVPKDAVVPEGGTSPKPDYTQLLGHVAGALSVTFNNVMLLALSLVVMVFVAFDPQVYERGVLWLVPKQHCSIVRETMNRLCVAMRWWIAGRLASMIAVGLLTSLGMWMIGMPAPMALGAIAGLLSFVPNIGPIAASVPGLLLALGQSPWMVLWVLCVYVVAQLVESNAITPGISVVNQFVLAALGGVWGMLIATPLLVVVMVLIQQLYVNQCLLKQIEVTGST